MYIPDEALPPITLGLGETPRLPSQQIRHGSTDGTYNKDNAGKSLFYYKEALADLALARHYASLDE